MKFFQRSYNNFGYSTPQEVMFTSNLDVKGILGGVVASVPGQMPVQIMFTNIILIIRVNLNKRVTLSSHNSTINISFYPKTCPELRLLRVVGERCYLFVWIDERNTYFGGMPNGRVN